MSNLQTPLPLPTENKTAGTVGKVIGGAVSGVVAIAEALAIAEQPWLGYPFIKQVWQAMFGWFADKFTRAAQTGATFAIIDHQVDVEESNITKALAAVLAAQKTGDAAQIKAAIKAYADANSALLNHGGSAHPTV